MTDKTLQERLRALAAQEERDVENGLEGCSLEHTKAEREAADAIDAQAERIKALEGALRDCLEKGSRWHPCDPVVVQARALLGEK